MLENMSLYKAKYWNHSQVIVFTQVATGRNRDQVRVLLVLVSCLIWTIIKDAPFYERVIFLLHAYYTFKTKAEGRLVSID